MNTGGISYHVGSDALNSSNEMFRSSRFGNSIGSINMETSYIGYWSKIFLVLNSMATLVNEDGAAETTTPRCSVRASEGRAVAKENGAAELVQEES